MKKNSSVNARPRNMRRLEKKHRLRRGDTSSALEAAPLLKTLTAITRQRPDDSLFSIVSLSDLRPIETVEEGSDPQLDALDDEFRRELNWTSRSATGRAPQMSGDVCVTQIRPQPEYNHDGSKQVVAFHREYYRGDDESRQGELQKFWDNQINIRPPTTEFIDSALSIWQATCINVPHGATAHMMKMNRIDKSTADALQAALFSTEMATLGQVDFDAIAYALCVFVHSHPAFLDMIPGNRIPSPYGENTVYGLADLVV